MLSNKDNNKDADEDDSENTKPKKKTLEMYIQRV